jgi:hypothetical protein
MPGRFAPSTDCSHPGAGAFCLVGRRSKPYELRQCCGCVCLADHGGPRKLFSQLSALARHFLLFCEASEVTFWECATCLIICNLLCSRNTGLLAALPATALIKHLRANPEVGAGDRCWGLALPNLLDRRSRRPDPIDGNQKTAGTNPRPGYF